MRMESFKYFPMDSPGNKGISRKPFNELTNSWNAKSPTEAYATPVKERQEGSPQDEALTPMANLKMLIRVASETDQIPSKRELFPNSHSNDDQDSNQDVPADLSMKSTLKRELSSSSIDHDYWACTPGHHENKTPSSTNSMMFGPPKISRKQKSLGLLCEKFIKRFPEAVPDGVKCEIPLDDLAKSMSTERRRIYDIVNVLEAVQMMTKVGKNLYQWHGTTYRQATLSGLHQLAHNLKLVDRFNEVKVMEENNPSTMYSFSPPTPSGLARGISPFTPTYASPCSTSSGPSPSPAERQTSLGVACQKFLMLFLIAPEPNYKINLEFAAKVIHGPVLPEAVMKTRIRRLYDIANILQSLQLIRKVQVTDQLQGCKKPAFEYIGPKVEIIESSKNVLESLPSTRQRNSLLGVGTNLANFPDDEPKSVPMNPKAHFMKRFNIAQHFNEADIVEEPRVERENKIPRTSAKENSFISPLNRSASFTNVTPSQHNFTIQRLMNSSSNGVDANNFISKTSFPTPQLITKSASFHSSPIVVKKPLQASSILNTNLKVVQFGSSPNSAGRWGVGNMQAQSKTVIALVSPNTNYYTAVQTSPVSLVMKKSLIKD